ncbi:hypothetical protein PHYSODRAFT_293685 [Phytophthora sojae]|uniref:Uncharacterized protein n=1 Tax=Phytophthora sojae (strain P6497) TaxID=1094619 RepID=G4YFZ1_PHYSP|nr:hypothetical protein PHYSODRAFT_293685 [Phytophthora sojae]EGZ28039.1 hypothetical protein PHYSODRAFT_293685 [Phytophthora sojae]|eukprot:XP_009515314.1 hypothetical protein PHYSODRAFT_293685 [Phytophthora sojae]
MSWENVGAAILGYIKLLPFRDGLGFALGLAEILSDNPAARTAVTTFLIEQASASSSSLKALALCDDVGLLWKLAVSSSNHQLFYDVEKLLKGLNGVALDHIVKMLAKCTDGTTFPEPYTTLVWLATRRCEWVTNEVAEIEKPFTWEFRDANFPGAVELAKFLDSPGRCYRIDGFKGIAEARARVETLLKTVKAPLTITASGRGQDAHVGVTKNGGEYDFRKENLSSYQEEIDMLRKLVVSSKEKATVSKMQNGLTVEKKGMKSL